ncbi:sigma-70 family RNA polymerase sigma factor [Candidatus Daviesbacteria bacterium]|nr:sigma-70 family RNA polymerase sigma factor [Candidatus Daviesbacteria bacterium]
MIKTPHKSFKYRSFELAYKAFAKPLMRFIIRKMNGDVEAAEEVFSQTLLAALNGYSAFEHKSSYFTWICKIALNKTADYYRELINQKSKFIAPSLELIAKIPASQLSPEEKLALDQLRISIHECLTLLPEEKRKLLYLRYWEDLTLQKIAEIMGTTERAIEGKIYRAKKELKEIILEKHPNLAYSFV